MKTTPKWPDAEMSEWSTNPQFFRKQCSFRTLFTSGTLAARASSSDRVMRLDIEIIAEDSELTDSARSINSAAHLREVCDSWTL